MFESNEYGSLDMLQQDLGQLIANERITEASLVAIDIDHLAMINETYGSTVGDEVIRVLTNHLMKSFPKNAKFYRCGGDLFYVLLPEVEKEDAFLFTTSVVRGLDFNAYKAERFKSLDLSVSVSAGVAFYPDDGQRANELIRRSDSALYRAKQSGRNKACLSREERLTPKTSFYSVEQLQMLADLAKRESIEEGSLLREAVDDLFKKYTQKNAMI